MEPQSSSAISVRPAPVLAGVGTFLLIAAAVSFVSARWDRFGPGDRFSVLLVFSALVFAAGGSLRRVAPSTARSLDVLMAALVPVDVAALAIVSGAEWPTVLLAAGPAAIAAAEALRRRDPSVVTEIGTVAGGILTACGLAAHFDIALAPIVATMGLVGCVVVPWHRGRLAGPAWATLAGLAPALRVLDEAAFTGDGTMRRLGLLDATPWEATLLAGVIGAGALAAATVARRSLACGTAAAAVVIATGAAMWAEHQPPRSLLVLAAAIVVALVEIALTSRAFVRVPQVGASVGAANTAANAALSFVVAAFALSSLLPAGGEFGPEWVYVAAALAFAWAVVDVRRMRADARAIAEGGGWAPATWGVAATAISGVALAAGAAPAGVVALGLGAAALASQRAGRLSLAWLSGVLAPLFLMADWRLAVVGAAVGVVLVAGAAVWGHRDHDETLGMQAVAGLVVPIAVAGSVVGEEWPAVAGAVVLGLLWLGATVIDVRLPSLATGLRGLGVVAVTAVAADDPVIVGLTLLGSAVAWLAHLAATRQYSSAVLGGWSVVLGGSLLAFDVVADPLVVTAATVAGAGCTLLGWGIDRDVEAARLGGGFTIWWASLLGLAGAGIGSLEPYLYPVLAALAWGLHRDAATERSRWMATVLPAAGAALIAFGQRIGEGAPGHTLLFGGLALALCVLGAVRKEQPALVIGGAATVAVGAFEALDQVVGIQSWSWLVVSGAAALTVAAMLELSDPELA